MCSAWLATEISEVLWQIDENQYWSYVSSPDINEHIFADDYLVKKAFETHLSAARLYNIRQEAVEEPKCKLVYVYEDIVSCSERQSKGLIIKRLSPVDHVYGSNPAFVLHGDIGDMNTRKTLKDLIASNRSFAFRPLLNDCSNEEKTVFNKAFGLSMEVKSAQLKPDMSWFPDSLRHLAKFSNTKSDSSLMGLKAVSMIMSSSDQFDALRSLSLNYPLLKESLSRVVVPTQFAQYMSRINQIYLHDSPTVIINGLEAQAEMLDAYSLTTLLMILRKHRVGRFDLMESWFERVLPRFRVPLNAAVTILNDLESDERYQRWPNQLNDFMRPSRTLLKHVALNLVNCVLIVDMHSDKSLNIVKHALEMIDKNVPIRFGFLPINIKAEEARFYYGILINLGLAEAITFLTRPRHHDIDSYATENPRIRTVAFMEECAKHDDAIAALKNYELIMEKFDLNRQGGNYAIVNGLVIKLSGNSLEEDSTSILEIYRKEVKAIQLLIMNRELKEPSDFYTEWLKINGDSVMDQSHHEFASLDYDSMSLNSNSKHSLISNRYNDIMMRHLGKSSESKKDYSRQKELISDIKEKMMALFPITEQAPPVSTAFMAPIIFGKTTAPLKITVVMSPQSSFAQRLVSLLDYFGKDTIYCKIYLFAVAQGAEREFNSFYTFLGAKSNIPAIDFAYALQPDCPAGWAIRVASTNHDLDNLKSSDDIRVQYSLKSLTVEGSVLDESTGGPAAGQRVELVDEDKKVVDKSIVMGNYGYYQLNAKPGTYSINTGHSKDRIVVDRMDSILVPRLKVHKTHIIMSRFRKSPKRKSKTIPCMKRIKQSIFSV
jgi:hypothetical protein